MPKYFCQGKRTRGGTCSHYAMTGSNFCRVHQPPEEAAARRAEAELETLKEVFRAGLIMGARLASLGFEPEIARREREAFNASTRLWDAADSIGGPGR